MVKAILQKKRLETRSYLSTGTLSQVSLVQMEKDLPSKEESFRSLAPSLKSMTSEIETRTEGRTFQVWRGTPAG